MGTDIHMYMEVLEEVKGQPIWINADDWRVNRYRIKYPGDEGEEGTFTVKNIYDDRNYGVFAILAGMRNDDGWEPISGPRGLPSDISEHTRAIWEERGEHTPSWLTLREILSYDWKKTVYKTKMVSKETADAYRKDGTLPIGYCTWTNQDSWETLTWPITTGEVAMRFLRKVIPRLKEEARKLRKWDRESRTYESEKNHYNHVRIVFWFDS